MHAPDTWPRRYADIEGRHPVETSGNPDANWREILGVALCLPLALLQFAHTVVVWEQTLEFKRDGLHTYAYAYANTHPYTNAHSSRVPLKRHPFAHKHTQTHTHTHLYKCVGTHTRANITRVHLIF